MKLFKNNLFIISLLLMIKPAFSQITDYSQKNNPMMELLGSNAKTLGLKGNVTQMHEQQFSINAKGIKTDSELINNFYKFYPEGTTKEFEQNYKYLQSENHFYSYNNNGYISHIDIETINLAKDKDSTNTTTENEASTPDFYTVDYKYVQKKNILYKGEEVTEGSSKMKTSKKEFFYHFNDNNQIVQIDNQSLDISTKYIYAPNGAVKETHTLKSGVLSYKDIYKYDQNNKLTSVTTINLESDSKHPNKEITISYKLDDNGNIIEKKMMTYLYSSKGTKDFSEGYLNLYNYTYL